jgi:hypothetical protein
MLLNVEIWLRRFFDGEQPALLTGLPGKGGQ